MSCLSKSQFKYISNNDNNKFYLVENIEEHDNFNFQYVPVNQFKYIIKDVRRQRVRNEEERVWNSFVKEQEQSISNYQTCNGIKIKSTRTLAESLKEVDEELMRLEADNFSETKCQIEKKSNQDENFSLKSVKKNSPLTKDNGTGSTNFLLTIPEEENIFYMTESSESHEPHKTYVRKSYSDQSIKNNKIYSRCYHYSTNDLDCNSSLNISPDHLSSENNSIPVHPDPVAVTKILSIQKKISTILDSISYELDRIPLPDGENDLHRRQQRVVEFSTRLSRNYLYDLGRQISDIQRHIKAIIPDNKMKLSRRGVILHMQAIEQKLISAHQLLLTALNAYWKHIPSSVLKNYPGKLKEILQIVVHLKNICTEIKLTPDFYCSGDDRDTFLGKETENRCSMILSKFKLNSDNESQIPSHTTRSTIITPSRSKKQRSRKMLSNRLSMYTIDMKLAKNYQPKKSHSMFQIPRDRRHIPLKQQQSNVLPASKKSQLTSFLRASNEAIGNKTKIRIPLKEDDIQTIMETVPSNLDAESSQSIKSNKKSYEAIESCENTKEYKRLNKNKTNNNKEITEDNDIKMIQEKSFSSFLPVIKDLLSLVENKPNAFKLSSSASSTALNKFFQTCHGKEDSTEFQTSTKDKVNAGPRNMKLICYSTNKNEEKMENYVNLQEQINVNIIDASCQANCLKNNRTLLVSESAIKCLTEYRNQYQDILKANPLYTSNTHNKPWEVVSWIADELVEELIVGISDDFQVKDVIQKLFDQEFQEF